MKIEDYVDNFREYAVGIEMDCPLGCADCCLNYIKRMFWEEGLKARKFLEEKGVDTSDFEDYEIEDKINGNCDFFGLACSINEIKPIVCSANLNNCEIKNYKKRIISQGHDFRGLELFNLDNYIIQTGKSLKQLTKKDMRKISRRVIEMTKKLGAYFEKNTQNPMKKEGLLALFLRL